VGAEGAEGLAVAEDEVDVAGGVGVDAVEGFFAVVGLGEVAFEDAVEGFAAAFGNVGEDEGEAGAGVGRGGREGGPFFAEGEKAEVHGKKIRMTKFE
jgi:hypothetical protein